MKNKSLIIFIFAILLLTVSSSLAQSKLRPSAGYWGKDFKQIPLQVSWLSKNRKLAAVGDTLYMLNARNHIVWSWTTEGAPLTDFPVIDSRGSIYAIAYDLTWVALNSKTGEKLWQGTANGRAVYSQIELYKKDMYLVVADMSGYAEKELLFGIQPKDNLILCRGNDILWTAEIPADSRIRVRRGKVYATFKRKKLTVVQRINIPRRFDKPIGKVDARVE